MVFALAGPTAQKLFLASFWKVSAPPLPAIVQEVSSIVVWSGLGNRGFGQLSTNPLSAGADTGEVSCVVVFMAVPPPPPGEADCISRARATGASGATCREKVCRFFGVAAGIDTSFAQSQTERLLFFIRGTRVDALAYAVRRGADAQQCKHLIRDFGEFAVA